MRILKSHQIIDDLRICSKGHIIDEQCRDIATELAKNKDLFNCCSFINELGYNSEVFLYILEPNEMEEYLKWKSQQRGK